MLQKSAARSAGSLVTVFLIAIGVLVSSESSTVRGQGTFVVGTPQDVAVSNAERLVTEGQQTFRYNTFGDEVFWGGLLRLNDAIAGAALGGIGPGVTPRMALALGLKLDVDALSSNDVERLRRGDINLDAPSTTLEFLRANAVVGLTGFFNSTGERLTSIGIQCALCHSTVDDSLTPGIGSRLDGWANRDLNVGAIVATSPNLQPIADLLETNVVTVRQVLNSWGPGKFDAQLLLDGKAFNPQQVSHGVVTGTGVSGATMIPNAFGLAGFNQHTWTGAWGNVSYWNAFVAALEMHGRGTFFDPRLDDADQFPIAAKNGFGHLRTPPDEDRITPKLAALQIYQLALPVPMPTATVDFSPSAAQSGAELFTGRARCNECHVKPLWTEPGWNLHSPADIGIDSFQADRSPGHAYKTQGLAALFIRENGLHMQPANQGRFYHDGRFATLMDVVNHYDIQFGLQLSQSEKLDLTEYLKSIPTADVGTQPGTFILRR